MDSEVFETSFAQGYGRSKKAKEEDMSKDEAEELSSFAKASAGQARTYGRNRIRS